MTAAIRMLAYGVAADVVDDYVRIGESTTIESLKRFVRAVVAIFPMNISSHQTTMTLLNY